MVPTIQGPSRSTSLDAKSVEKIYGNLDELYAKDCIAEVLQELEYAAA